MIQNNVFVSFVYDGCVEKELTLEHCFLLVLLDKYPPAVHLSLKCWLDNLSYSLYLVCFLVLCMFIVLINCYLLQTGC